MEKRLDKFGYDPQAASKAEWESALILEAAYFTCVWRQGPGKLGREEYPALKLAIEATAGKSRPMVYAVHASERSCLIAPAQYQHYLDLRREI